jgi:hypothetical protein
MSTQQQTLSAGHAEARRGWASRAASLLEEEGTLVVVVAAFAAVLIVDLRNMLLTDGWMALLSGRVIVEHGLPSHDMLTVWAHGRSWVDQQWLAQVTLYGLERLGGLLLVLLVHAALVVGAFAGAAVLARRRGGSARSTTWVAIPALLAFWPGAAVMRPQSFTYALLIAVLWLLLDDLERPSRRVFLVLPLLVLWANLHGSVLVGAALVSGYALVEIIGALHRDRRSVRPRSLVLLVAPWLCVLASPYATSLPHYYREIFTSGFGSTVSEWAPTKLTFLYAPAYLLVLGGVWLLGRTGGKASAFEKLAFVGLSLLAFEAVRNIVWLALFSLVLLPRLVDEVRAAPAVEPKRINRILALAMLAAVLVAIIGVSFKPTSWLTRQYPTAAGDAAAAAAGTHGRVFANERYADWLMFEHPRLEGRVAYDSRFELLTREQIALVGKFRNLVEGWRSTIRGYRVLVLYRPEDGQPIRAIVRGREGRAVLRRGQTVVLTHR